jgi:hypothetical protein
MDSDDLVDRLDFWTGRRSGRSSEEPRRRRGGREPRPSRGRPLAAAALVAALAAGWLVVSRQHDEPVSHVAGDASTRPGSSTTARPSATAQLHALLGRSRGCVDVHGGAVPEVSCVIDGVRVDARLVGAAALGAYTTAAGARPSPRRGPPACGSGRPDERAWSRPAAPSRPVGRYRCRIEGDRAGLWWTDDHGLVAHASAADRDLAHLFAWWRSHVLD